MHIEGVGAVYSLCYHSFYHFNFYFQCYRPFLFQLGCTNILFPLRWHHDTILTLKNTQYTTTQFTTTN